MSEPTELEKAIESSESTIYYTRNIQGWEFLKPIVTAAKRVQELEKENTTLRAMVIKHECLYGHRNSEGVCSRGYPGCACADDLFCFEESHFTSMVQERDQLRTAYKDALEASNNLLEVMKQWPQGTKAYAEAFQRWYEVTTNPLAIEILKKGSDEIHP